MRAAARSPIGASMLFVRRAGSLFAIAGCLSGQPAVGQILDAGPGKFPAGQAGDIGVPASISKPMKLEFDVPPTIIGPALDSIKRQLDSASSTTTRDAASAVPREEPPPVKESGVLRVPAAVGEPAAAAKDAPPAPIAVPPLRLSELQRLSKEEILASVTDKFAAYVLRGSEQTVVFDFPTAQAQGRIFGRVILFIEREGTSKTRVMTVPEVQKWLAKNAKTISTLTIGNNIRIAEFARFFNTARFQGEPLTSDEQGLRDWLLQMQLLREDEFGVSALEPDAIVVSVPQVSTVPGCAMCSVSPAMRMVTVEHEFSHARFATDIPYQHYVMWFWSHGMNPAARGKFTQFLRKRGYDTSNRELSANEMQAFLMHTPDPAVFSAADLGMTEAELADLRRSFQAGLSQQPLPKADGQYRLD